MKFHPPWSWPLHWREVCNRYPNCLFVERCIRWSLELARGGEIWYFRSVLSEFVNEFPSISHGNNGGGESQVLSHHASWWLHFCMMEKSWLLFMHAQRTKKWNQRGMFDTQVSRLLPHDQSRKTKWCTGGALLIAKLLQHHTPQC